MSFTKLNNAAVFISDKASDLTDAGEISRDYVLLAFTQALLIKESYL